MSLITPNPPAKIDADTWRFTWTNSGGPYRVYYKGRRIATTSAATIDIFEPEPFVPSIEIATADADVPLQTKHPGRIVLQWRNPEDGPTVLYYRIEALSGGSWVLEDIVMPNPRRYHLWTSERLDNDVTHERRIVPVVAGEHQLAAVAFAIRIVRMPDLPRTSVSYDAGTGQVTVESA